MKITRCGACGRATRRRLCSLCWRRLPVELLELARRTEKSPAWLAAAVGWLNALGIIDAKSSSEERT